MKKIELKIRTFGEDALRKKSVPVKEVTESHRELLSSMAQLMYDSSGIGLAAPQVGFNLAIIVVDIGQGLYKVVNPKIIKKEGSQAIEEGCLSVPGVSIKVKRANKINIIGLDESNKNIEISAQGLLACVFQHEIDHLNGRLIVDYASILDKIKIRKTLKSLIKQKNGCFASLTNIEDRAHASEKEGQSEGLSKSKTKSSKLQL